MALIIESRTCQACGDPIKGRIDKKFCDDNCRNNHNNQQRARENYSPFVRNVNNAMLRNRKVLGSILSGDAETARASKDKLQRLGFQFKYLTHFYTNRSGKTYFYCYDYGYLPLDNDWYLVVRRRDE